MEKEGLHIIADFFSCTKNTDLLVNKRKLRKFLTDLIKKNNLNILKNDFYKFKGGGITGYVLLSESHVAIHTWPERNNYFTFDVFVCNYNKNNTANARKIFHEVVKAFQPKKLQKKFIKRK